MHGRFITFEGGEGAGKSTQISRAASGCADAASSAGHARAWRHAPCRATACILLERDAEPMPQSCELLLMFAARATHLDNLIRPAVRRGRGSSATVSPTRRTPTRRRSRHARGPDRCPGGHRASGPATGPHAAARPARAGGPGARLASQWADGPDRFESEQQAFFERVRDTYLERARREPRRFRVVAASGSLDEVAQGIREALEPLLEASR